ncbi:MAG TPA: hypothetical protein VFT74_08705 [Isosphaeraceae bacterium]|nr:hypothetical protein [Isosphaeraceae bacterium]
MTGSRVAAGDSGKARGLDRPGGPGDRVSRLPLQRAEGLIVATSLRPLDYRVVPPTP